MATLDSKSVVVKNNVSFEFNRAAFREGRAVSRLDEEGRGGGMFADMVGGAIEIADGVVFRHNTGNRGGGLSVSGQSVAACSIRGNVTFEANTAYFGGGIFVSGVLLHLQEGLEVTQHRQS